jgi:short-subunit dehydrogenase
MSKTILITGASSGIGAGMAKEFAKKGYNLAICARRLDRLLSLKDEIEHRFNVQVSVKILDVTHYDQVFTVFREFKEELGTIDRVIVNAGVGNGRRIGKGNFEINRATVETNFISAMAQCDAAVEIFRSQNSGHLVVISSMSALRGMPKHLTAYAASKAGIALLAEGIRAELLNTPIKVSTIYPGYIRTEINEGAGKLPFEVDQDTGSRLLAEAIENQPVKAYVPKWPWLPIGIAMKILPLKLVNKLS